MKMVKAWWISVVFVLVGGILGAWVRETKGSSGRRNVDEIGHGLVRMVVNSTRYEYSEGRKYQ